MIWAALQGPGSHGCMLIRDCIGQLSGHNGHPALAHLWHITQLPPNIYHADAHITRCVSPACKSAVASNKSGSHKLGTKQASRELTVEPQSRPLCQLLNRR